MKLNWWSKWLYWYQNDYIDIKLGFLSWLLVWRDYFSLVHLKYILYPVTTWSCAHASAYVSWEIWLLFIWHVGLHQHVMFQHLFELWYFFLDFVHNFLCVDKKLFFFLHNFEYFYSKYLLIQWYTHIVLRPCRVLDHLYLQLAKFQKNLISWFSHLYILLKSKYKKW